MPIKYIKSRQGRSFALTQTRLIEVTVGAPAYSIFRYQVARAMRQGIARDFEFPYNLGPRRRYTSDGYRLSSSIRLGCCLFADRDYRKLRRWALAGN